MYVTNQNVKVLTIYFFRDKMLLFKGDMEMMSLNDLLCSLCIVLAFSGILSGK